jgi:predicted Zn-dependent protease
MPLLLMVEAEPIPDAARQDVLGICRGALHLETDYLQPTEGDRLVPEEGLWLSAPAVLDAVRALGSQRRRLALVSRELRSVRGLPISGQAERGGYVAVVTAYILASPSDVLPSEEALVRFVRCAAHEVGHLGGLGHCGRAGCLMHPRPDRGPAGPWGSLFCPTCAPLWEHALSAWDR